MTTKHNGPERIAEQGHLDPSQFSNLQKAMLQIENHRQQGGGIAVRGGKKYTEIVDRIDAFRKFFDTSYGISTEILFADNTYVQMKATIRDESGREIATGHAEEVRANKGVNSTSALENCETSAVGRALAMLGLHGGSIASAEEVIQAIETQDSIDKLKAYMNKAIERFPNAESHYDAWESISKHLHARAALIKSNVELTSLYEELLTLKKEVLK